MSTIQIGETVADFDFIATNNIEQKLSNLRGQAVILYFYPKDNTPGCTMESKGFRDNFLEFKKLNATIYGISRDSIKSHENFKKKLELPFELISDKTEKLCQLFAVIKQKSLFGKKYLGIERSTFLLDTEGRLRQEWRKLKIKGHITQVLNELSLMS